MPTLVQTAMEELDYLVEPPYDYVRGIRQIVFKVMKKIKCSEQTVWNAWRRLKEKWKKDEEEFTIIKDLLKAIETYNVVYTDIIAKTREMTTLEHEALGKIDALVERVEEFIGVKPPEVKNDGKGD